MTTWHRAVESVAVGPGVIADATIGSDDVVVWRSRSGALCAMAARCPHNWSHLGAEGAVDGDEIVCTSHFWRFATNGEGSKLNVGGRRDEKAPIAVYRTREVDGWIEIGLDG